MIPSITCVPAYAAGASSSGSSFSLSKASGTLCAPSVLLNHPQRQASPGGNTKDSRVQLARGLKSAERGKRGRHILTSSLKHFPRSSWDPAAAFESAGRPGGRRGGRSWHRLQRHSGRACHRRWPRRSVPGSFQLVSRYQSMQRGMLSWREVPTEHRCLSEITGGRAAWRIGALDRCSHRNGTAPQLA